MPSADVSVRSLLYRWCSLWELTEENRTRGVRREAPKAARSIGVEGGDGEYGGGVSLPSQLGCLGSVVKLPQQGSLQGGAPAAKRGLVHFEL